MLGYKTIRKEHRSTSRGRGTNQVSINHTDEKRALFLPQEIKELPADDELIFYEGCKPIRAKKNWYFRDKQLKARASVAPAVIRAATPLPESGRPDGPKEVIRAQHEQARKWLQ
jgi:type IV secretion system protein VirD4